VSPPLPTIPVAKSNQRFNVMFVEDSAQQIALPVSFEYCTEFAAAGETNPLKRVLKMKRKKSGSVKHIKQLFCYYFSYFSSYSSPFCSL
jgi:hypothetical protein